MNYKENEQHSAHLLRRKFRKYVAMNIVGMIGYSAYILVDTYFISIVGGANGITALNLTLPVYSLIYAIGSLIGIGSATLFSISRAQGKEEAKYIYSNAMIWALILSIPFVLCGIFIPDRVLALFGADAEIVKLGTTYARIFMTLAPAFMWNIITTAFVRNDQNPRVAMIATFVSSFFNIAFDYIFMIPLGMGMAGAALATALSPLVSVLICALGHLIHKNSHVKLYLMAPKLSMLLKAVPMGASAFVGDIQGGITTLVFNFLILGIAGNDGVAAYGVVANMAIVANAVFNGIAQGAQPIWSDSYGKGREEDVMETLRLAIVTSLAAAVVLLMTAQIFPEEITAFFNSEQNPAMANYARVGVRIYFSGYVFAGFNIVGCNYLSAVNRGTYGFLASILRGMIAISGFGILLSVIFGMPGIWMSFPAAEFVTAIVTAVFIFKGRRD